MSNVRFETYPVSFSAREVTHECALTIFVDRSPWWWIETVYRKTAQLMLDYAANRLL